MRSSEMSLFPYLLLPLRFRDRSSLLHDSRLLNRACWCQLSSLFFSECEINWFIILPRSPLLYQGPTNFWLISLPIIEKVWQFDLKSIQQHHYEWVRCITNHDLKMLSRSSNPVFKGLGYDQSLSEHEVGSNALCVHKILYEQSTLFAGILWNYQGSIVGI